MSGATPPPDGPLTLLDLVAVRRWAVLTRSLFAARRVEIDAMNVFPVPDGDTGTNLYLTFDGAVERTLATADVTTADELLSVFAKHLLWTARGNSGVILSQLARGLAEGCAGAARIDGRILAAGLRHAEVRARQAVTDPKEGTILTVASAMAEAAEHAVHHAASTPGDHRRRMPPRRESCPGGGTRRPRCRDVHAVALAAVEASREALARTPEQLEVLARAGVVDAGGAGLVVLLECLERVCAGQRARSGADDSDRRFRRRPDLPGAAHDVRPSGRADEEGMPEFEVMYFLADSDDAAVDVLRTRLVQLGDSVLVVGGDGEWNVHAHVDDAGAAVEAGIEAGRPHRVRITRLAGRPRPRQQGRTVRGTRRVAALGCRDRGLRGRRRARRPLRGCRCRRRALRSRPESLHRRTHQRDPRAARPGRVGRRRPAQRRRHAPRRGGSSARGRRRRHRGAPRPRAHGRSGHRGARRLRAGRRRLGQRAGDAGSRVGHPARRGHRRQPGGAHERWPVPRRATSSGSSTATSSSSVPTSSP